jgi:redox-sensitive bicupin YhaK (pirin superfamily)
VHFLQIWIKPSGNGYSPSYEQKRFSRESKTGQLRLIASPDGSEGSVMIGQDANVYATILEPETEIALPVAKDRHLWIQMIKGRARLGDQTLKAGDGASVSEEEALSLTAVEECEALVFDLA